jgi:hypothetical protein
MPMAKRPCFYKETHSFIPQYIMKLFCFVMFNSSMFLRSYQSKRVAASFLADNNVFKEAIVKKALLILQGDAPKFILSYLSFSASLWNE